LSTHSKGRDPGPITGLQLDVLRVLWARGEATVADVQSALAARRRLAPTTVATLLKRLAARGVVTHRSEGRALVYRALLDEAQVASQAIDEVATQVFQGDVAAFAAELLRREDIDQGDLERIRVLIEARARELDKDARES